MNEKEKNTRKDGKKGIVMVEALNQALTQEMKRDSSVIVLGEDVGKDGGVFRVTDKLLEKFSEERVIDTPLAESAIVGTSIGLAITGFKPVAEIQFSGFIPSAFDQMINHLSRMRWRSRGRYTCPVVIRSPNGGGVKALEHHSESLESVYAHIPGLKVVIPSTPYNAKGLLISAIRDPDPVLFLEPIRVYRSIREVVPEESYTIPIGKARIIKEGSHVTIIGWGAMIKTLINVQNSINIDLEIIDLQTISPLDTETIINSVKKTKRCVIVHEAARTCGFGAELAAQIYENAILHLKAPIVRVTGFDITMPLGKLEKYYIPDEARIIEGIKEALRY